MVFVVAPLIAGVDKFVDSLGAWDQYLVPMVPRMLGLTAHQFMMVVGVIEIIAGVGVAVKPRIFAYVVSAWLALIIVNLLLTGMYFDIALRDLGLCLAAFCLARLACDYDHGPLGGLLVRERKVTTISVGPTL